MDLHVTSPLIRGPYVLGVQRQLETLGLCPGPLDGTYGPATAAAVREFQASHGLPEDGIVGAQTLGALTTAAANCAGVVRGRLPSAIGRDALIEAIKHLGVKEQPPGSNKTKFGVWFGLDGVPWCNIFVSYCFQVGAKYTLCEGFKGAGIRPGKGCAYVPTTEAWLRVSGMWVGRTTPQPGDIAIFNWNGGEPDHIGIVEANLGKSEFQSIEGNTLLGNCSHGGEVMRRRRDIMEIDGLGRVVVP